MVSYEPYGWYCEYLLQFESNPNKYLVVLFPQFGGEFGREHDPYMTRTFILQETNSKEIKSSTATRLRDGGSTYFQTSEGKISLPFGEKGEFGSEKVIDLWKEYEHRILTTPFLKKFFDDNDFLLHR